MRCLKNWLAFGLSTLLTPVYATDLNDLAKEYVLLSLAMGGHDAAYVDAYYGPVEWQTEVKAHPLALATIGQRALTLQTELAKQSPCSESHCSAESAEGLRLEYLRKQLLALLARLEMLQGKPFSFDQETAALYDTVAPTFSRDYFLAIHQEISALLPGSGSLALRINAFRRQFVIPKDKLKGVFEAAIQGCRQRTLAHLPLPAGENFTLEFVTDKPWSGYNWYQGNYQSLIQINVELPIYIERAVDIGCHEGYPGHHTYNALLEKNLVKDRGWREFSVYPLWSPQSLIAEGSANYGVELAFSDAERVTFEREVLYPLAGLNPALAAQYETLRKLLGKLSYADNEAAREYVDGRIDREQAIEWLINVELYPAEKARQRTQFFDANRGYVINYNVGKDLVKDYVGRQTASAKTEAEATDSRWTAFVTLLSSPRLPSGLK